MVGHGLFTHRLSWRSLKSKNQTNLIAHEILAFSQVLGHHEVGYFGDNEPTVRQILPMLLNARHALGLRTRVFTTKIKDPAGNGLAENAIGRIRSLAGTLVGSLWFRSPTLGMGG